MYLPFKCLKTKHKLTYISRQSDTPSIDFTLLYNKMKEIDSQGNSATTKDKNMYSILELGLEMYERGINFLPIDLYKSHPTKFTITKKGLLPPLASLSGVGNSAALAIAAVRDPQNPFISREDLRLRAGIGKAVVERMAEMGVLNDLPESNQIDLF